MIRANNMYLNIDSTNDVELFLPASLEEENTFVLEIPDPIEPLIEDILSKENKKVVKLDFTNRSGTTRRSSDNINSRMESALAGLIEQRIQTKALPLVLRKRLMYERACSS